MARSAAGFTNVSAVSATIESFNAHVASVEGTEGYARPLAYAVGVAVVAPSGSPNQVAAAGIAVEVEDTLRKNGVSPRSINYRVYHAGAEWKFWPGPDTCAAGAMTSDATKSILERLKNTQVVRCDEAAGRFLGLSFAGWNVFLSLALCIGALQAAFAVKYNNQ